MTKIIYERDAEPASIAGQSVAILFLVTPAKAGVHTPLCYRR